MIDPFVRSHGAPENDNGKINLVSQLWSTLADLTDIAIDLTHHVRKGQSGQGEYTAEDGRGASALLAAVRSARVLNTMAKDEAERYGIENRRRYFRVDNGKSNLAPPPDKADWREIVSVPLGNGPLGADGDYVGVVMAWEPPSPLDWVKGVADLRTAQAAVAES